MATANIRAVITAEDRASATLRGFGNKVEDVGHRIGRVAQRAALAFGAATVAATGFAIKSASDLEKTNTSFQILIGNVTEANKLFGEIKQFADKTPFQFPELASATRLLLGYGVSAEKSFEILKQLGDAAGATGGDLNGITLAFAQMLGRGKVTGDNLRQLTENFVNLRPELARIAGVELKNFDKEMEKGTFTSEMLLKALKQATSEGGRFFKGTDKLAQTFAGRMSTLVDTLAEMGRNLLGVKVDPELGFVVQEGGLFDRLSKAVLWLNENLPKLRDAFSRLTAPIRDLLEGGVKGLINAWEFLRPSFESFWKTIQERLIPALKEFWHETLEPLMPVIGGLLVGAIWLVVGAVEGLIRVISSIVEWFNDLVEGIKEVIGWFQSIYDKLAHGDGAWADFRKAADDALGPIDEIIGSIIRNLDKLIGKIDSAVDKAGGVKKAFGGGLTTGFKAVTLKTLSPLTNLMNKKQRGGPVSSGQPYMVGERRPELFVPREAGRIVPQPRMGGGNQTINLNVNVGVYAGSPMEKRKLAEDLFRSLQDISRQRNISVSKLVGA